VRALPMKASAQVCGGHRPPLQAGRRRLQAGRELPDGPQGSGLVVLDENPASRGGRVCPRFGGGQSVSRQLGVLGARLDKKANSKKANRVTSKHFHLKSLAAGLPPFPPFATWNPPTSPPGELKAGTAL